MIRHTSVSLFRGTSDAVNVPSLQIVVCPFHGVTDEILSFSIGSCVHRRYVDTTTFVIGCPVTESTMRNFTESVDGRMKTMTESSTSATPAAMDRFDVTQRFR